MPLFKGCGCKAKPAKAIDYITDEKKTVYGKTEKIVKDKLRELQIQSLAGNLYKKENLKSIISLSHRKNDEILSNLLSALEKPLFKPLYKVTGTMCSNKNSIFE